MTSKLERTQAPSSQRVTTRPQVARAEAPRVEAPKAEGPRGKPPEPRDLSAVAAKAAAFSPGGTAVARSADPGALWGGGQAEADQAFLALEPAQQQAELQALRAQRDELTQKIAERVGVLDQKWEQLPTFKKVEALREYRQRSTRLDPATRAEVDSLLEQAQARQKKINSLRAQAAKLGPARLGRGTPEQRHRLAVQLAEARRLQKKEVKAATRVIDAKGLKLDRLRQTERLIDPGAPKGGLLSTLVDGWNFVMRQLDHFLSLSSTLKLMQKIEEHRQEQVAADNELEQQLLAELEKSARLHDEAVASAKSR